MKKTLNLEDKIYSQGLYFPEFSGNLKTLLKVSSSTPKEFAERYGVTVGSVYNWLSGKSFPRKEVLTAIINDYRIPILKLVGPPCEVRYKNVYSKNFKR